MALTARGSKVDNIAPPFCDFKIFFLEVADSPFLATFLMCDLYFLRDFMMPLSCVRLFFKKLRNISDKQSTCFFLNPDMSFLRFSGDSLASKKIRSL